MASKKDRMKLRTWGEFTVLDLADIEIWDGADLALLRETLYRQIEDEEHRKIGVNMQYVKYIPSGFFGMLYDWHETGVEIRLYSPQPHVQNMLWFRQFFRKVEEGCWELTNEPKEGLIPETDPEWSDEIDWGFEDEQESFAALRRE